ncbi:MAG: MgtC/SapB family protein [Candidatus Dormibacteria bacterium]
MNELDLLWRLGLALVLSTAIGVERELRLKSAGLRTHTIVGLGAALIMLISKYGFSDVVGSHVTLDPSRIAAQVVSGIGFIGGGLIFVRRDSVRGLTTAATIWLTAGVGMACGASLPLLATAATGGYFLVAFVYADLQRRLPRSLHAPSTVRMTILSGAGVLREALANCTQRGFSVTDVSVDRTDHDGTEEGRGLARVTLQVEGPGEIDDLIASLSDQPRVVSVSSEDGDQRTD